MDLCFTPESIRSDSGTCFIGQKFQAFCKEWGISHEPSSPHHKMSNGHAESNIKKVKKLLEIHNGVYSKEFRHGLNVLRSTPNIELSTRNGAEGPSSVQLLYGRQTKLPSHPCLESCYQPISWKFASDYKKETARIRRQYYDNNARTLKELKVNQRVVVQDPLHKGLPFWLINRLGNFTSNCGGFLCRCSCLGHSEGCLTGRFELRLLFTQ